MFVKYPEQQMGFIEKWKDCLNYGFCVIDALEKSIVIEER